MVFISRSWNRVFKSRARFWIFLAKALTGIVILKHAHLAKRLNSQLSSKIAQHLLPQVVNSIMCKSIRLKQLPHSYKQPHGSPSTPPTRPFTYLLTKLGTCTPTHESTPSAHAHPKQEHEHSHFMSWEKQPATEGHRLYTSKNVRWFVGSSPSHFNFLPQTFDCD